MLINLLAVYLALMYWVILGFGAILYYKKRRILQLKEPEIYPKTSILIPAHNEALVIAGTLEALLKLDYPNLEIIVINDGSTDNTEKIVRRFVKLNPFLKLINVPAKLGGRGKSAALNYGLTYAEGQLVAVYDADNQPEPPSLKRLVQTLLADPKLVAVNGKVRTLNYKTNLLTQFINIEFLFLQWLFQAGRQYIFKGSALMGTNYVIYRQNLVDLGGFNETSLVDDLELSMRLFMQHKRIAWIPEAVSWEQEPDNLRVWLRQRTRWAKGNISVFIRYFSYLFRYPRALGPEYLNIFCNYILLLFNLFLGQLLNVLNYFELIDLEQVRAMRDERRTPLLGQLFDQI